VVDTAANATAKINPYRIVGLLGAPRHSP
jgi:hypothetical protein